jgi:hypothetical protein
MGLDFETKAGFLNFRKLLRIIYRKTKVSERDYFFGIAAGPCAFSGGVKDSDS